MIQNDPTLALLCDTPPLASTSSIIQPSSAKRLGKHEGARTKSKKPKLEQLYLDPYTDTASHSTLSCAICSLSYARTPEDMALHRQHHARVVGGCDWVAAADDDKAGIVLEESVEYGQEEQRGRVVMVDAGVSGRVGRKVSPLCAAQSVRY